MRAMYLGITLLATGGLLTGGVLQARPAAAATATTGIAATGGSALNVRSTPSAALARRGTVANGGHLTLVCRTDGQLVHGYVRTTNQWDRLPNALYVSDAYIRRGAAPPPCPVPVPPGGPRTGTPISQGWMVPVVAPLGDGFRTHARPTHQGVDLLAKRNTPIRATADGTVITVTCNASTKKCDVDGGPTVMGCGWYVEIEHAGRVVTRYCHLVRKPLVQVGQRVTMGQVIGYVGSSGHSSGPHLHFEIHVNAPPARSTNAVDPAAFMRGKGTPLGQ